MKKTRIAAFLLAQTGGLIGLDKFYLGYTGQGVARILLTVFTFGTVSTIWSIISAWVYLMSRDYSPHNDEWYE